MRTTSELIVDFSRKQQRGFHLLLSSGFKVERVDTFLTISQDLSWIQHINIIAKKRASKRL